LFWQCHIYTFKGLSTKVTPLVYHSHSLLICKIPNLIVTIFEDFWWFVFDLLLTVKMFQDDHAITMAFSKKAIDQRKDWLTNWMEEGKRRKELGLPEVYLYEKNTKAVTYQV